MTHATTWFDLIRHGEPQGGRRYRGHLDDPLSDTGWAQMRAAIRADDQWDAVLSSPLSRCRAFAEEISTRRQCPLHVEPDLKEISFGDWEGHTLEALQRDDGERLAAFWADGERHPPPNGENLGDFYRRVRDAWRHWSATLSGQRVLLVGHSGMIRMVLADALRLPPAHAMASLVVPYAGRSRLRIDDTDHGRLISLVHHGVLP
ncbi:histidine phosphatase family protein [Alloalcanivorax mobilis]|uniref:histidine phosphatase family protein n=1 Tax=Alloalcanivorax mobilis TaxID=2019569 RepID=UPI000C756D66|nr:alpha-ribazole phosphatase family protein [Alloalcanivorax mobilis]